MEANAARPIDAYKQHRIDSEIRFLELIHLYWLNRARIREQNYVAAKLAQYRRLNVTDHVDRLRLPLQPKV